MGVQYSAPTPPQSPTPGAPSAPSISFPTITPPKCPVPFVSADALSCLMPCPTEKKFVRQGSTNGGFKCVYSPDEQFAVNLVTVGAAVFNGSTMADLQKSDPQKYAEFSTEKDRFDREITVLYANIDKQQKLNDAFKDLQKAENARAESPVAYQAARTAYYTLLKGDGWLAEERERVAKADVVPETQKYRDSVSIINARTQDQQKTIDVANGLKDRVLSLRDDFRYSVSTFSDQLEKLKAQINMENRSRDKEKDNTWAWIDTILNILLVAVLLYAVYTFVRRYFISTRPPTAPIATIRIPTYTGQPVYR